MARSKRTKTQIVRDRARVAELALQKYTQREIIQVLLEETGIHLTQQQISYDLQKVKKEWLKVQHENYGMLMTRELARIDALESEIWRAMRDSVRDRERHIIEKARRKVRESQADDIVVRTFPCGLFDRSRLPPKGTCRGGTR